MPQLRTHGATAAIVAALLLAFTSVAVAQGNVTVWRLTPDADVFPAEGQDNSGRELILGLAGADTIDAGDKGDIVRAGAGDDTVEGGPGRDLVFGGSGNDILSGGTEGDVIKGRADDDIIYGGDGADRIHAGSGDDGVRGGPGPDHIMGGLGNDRLAGGPGRDVIKGGAGDDIIFAADGERDRIHCGPGFDRVKADRLDWVARDCELVRRLDPALAP